MASAPARSPSPAGRTTACKPLPFDGLGACASKAPPHPPPSPQGGEGANVAAPKNSQPLSRRREGPAKLSSEVGSAQACALPRTGTACGLSRRREGPAKLSSEVGSAQACALPRTGTACGLSRSTTPPLDLQDESGIRAAAEHIATLGIPLRLVMVATGFLHGGGFHPEKALKQLDADHMAKAFAVNVIGPALLMKHLLPLLAPQGKSVFAVLSAKVGSIGDNRLGGWHSYRTSKAALNQIVRTAAIELQRRRPGGDLPGAAPRHRGHVVVRAVRQGGVGGADAGRMRGSVAGGGGWVGGRGERRVLRPAWRGAALVSIA